MFPLDLSPSANAVGNGLQSYTAYRALKDDINCENNDFVTVGDLNKKGIWFGYFKNLCLFDSIQIFTSKNSGKKVQLFSCRKKN